MGFRLPYQFDQLTDASNAAYFGQIEVSISAKLTGYINKAHRDAGKAPMAETYLEIPDSEFPAIRNFIKQKMYEYLKKVPVVTQELRPNPDDPSGPFITVNVTHYWNNKKIDFSAAQDVIENGG